MPPRHDSDSPPSDRLEHFLQTLRSVEDEVRALAEDIRAKLIHLEKHADSVEERTASTEVEIEELRTRLTTLQKRLSRDQLHEAEAEAERTSKISRLEIELAQLKAAKHEAVSAITEAGSGAAKQVQLSGRMAVVINGAIALAGILAAAGEYLLRLVH
jgi:predicted RNase H-like nuclease (RuvC/YqgF family)